jgi:hypothetical protein
METWAWCSSGMRAVATLIAVLGICFPPPPLYMLLDSMAAVLNTGTQNGPPRARGIEHEVALPVDNTRAFLDLEAARSGRRAAVRTAATLDAPLPHWIWPPLHWLLATGEGDSEGLSAR